LRVPGAPVGETVELLVQPAGVRIHPCAGDIATTFDRYGHLMPGNEAQAAGLLDAYLAGFED
jgi:hypothetical protein